MKPLTLLLVTVFLIEIDFINVIYTLTPPPPAHSALYFNSTKAAKIKTIPENVNNTKIAHRLVGGHILHPVYRRDDEQTPQQTTRLTKLYFRRKRLPFSISSEPDDDNQQRFSSSISKKSLVIDDRSRNSRTSNYQEPSFSDDVSDDDDDSELLSDDNNSVDNNFDRNDGLLRASAGAGKETTPSSSSSSSSSSMPNNKKDDSKKTLSDQVAEGKYGLIQNELFKKIPKRPGIVSYLPNPEVPNDTVENLGGLDEDDIWLAEDHLLVLKGGTLNKKKSEDPWKPIDSYEAPLRQVQIPDNPKVPPPFLVQLEENGPIQFIGNNKFPLINPFTNESLLLFPESGFPKTETYDNDQTNIFARPRPYENFTHHNGYQYPPPIPPSWLVNNNNNNQTFQNPFLMPPIRSPFPAMFPQGSLENSNITDFFDEDDPSLYYPPPYSFTYKSNYTNLVPPGPLVPGIILPPPPNFFLRQTTQKPLSTTTTSDHSLLTTTSRQYKQIVRPVLRLTTARPTSIRPPTTTTTPRYSPEIQTELFKIVGPAPTKPPPSTTSTTTTLRTVTTLKQILNESPQHELISFVPKEPQFKDSNKGNPVYFEYFDARTGQQTNAPTTSSQSPLLYSKHVPVSASAPILKPVYKQLLTTRLRAQKPTKRPYNSYLPAVKPFDYDKYVYITPKPEITPNGISNNILPIGNSGVNSIAQQSSRPSYQSFEKEVDTIRQTLQFYKTKQQQQAQPYKTPRNPKAKAVYEYSFNASPSTAAPSSEADNSKNVGTKAIKFAAPSQFDSSPFKPMVQYSEPLNSDDGFKAISSTPSPTDYYSTTTVSNTNNRPVSVNRATAARQYIPKAPVIQYLPILVSSKDNPDDEYYNNNADYTKTNNGQPETQQQYSTINQQNSQPQWVSIEKQEFRELQPKEINVQIEGNVRSQPIYSGGYNRHPIGQQQYNDYYYKQPETVYSQAVKTQPQQNDYYQKQIESIRQQLINRYPEPQEVYSYANDTAVNYKHPRPPINPDSEFIDFSSGNDQRIQQQQQQQQQPRLPPPPNRFYHNKHPIPIQNKDILVNYKYPLPPINSDSEQLPQDFNSRYTRRYQNPIIQYRLPGDQAAGVYFFTPREVRYSKR